MAAPMPSLFICCALLSLLLFLLCSDVRGQCGCDDCCGCCGNNNDNLAIGGATMAALAAQSVLNSAQGAPPIRVVSLGSSGRRRRSTMAERSKFQFGNDPTPFLMGWPIAPGQKWPKAPMMRETPEREWYRRMEEEGMKRAKSGRDE